MKNLTKKQKAAIVLAVIALLVGSYLWGVRPNKSDTRATVEEVEDLKTKENEDLKSYTGEHAQKGILISSDRDEVKPGETEQFKLTDKSGQETQVQVDWEILVEENSGPLEPETKITETGLLTISTNEKPRALNVVATQKDDPSIQANKVIKVADGGTKQEIAKPRTQEELRQKAAQEQQKVSPERRQALKEAGKKQKQEIIQSQQGGEKDRYLTDPTPAGKPKPVEPQDVSVDTSKVLTATLSIRCDTILDNLDIFDMDKIDALPVDGVILAPTKVKFSTGESVFDVLQRETRSRGIHMEAEFTPMYNSAYVQGIHNLYEFDCGELSGWMYNVNGWFPNYGASRYQLKDGDVINWVYTCDLGQDVGDNSMVR